MPGAGQQAHIGSGGYVAKGQCSRSGYCRRGLRFQAILVARSDKRMVDIPQWYCQKAYGVIAPRCR